mmetsp:Transcript_109059/g.304024  ORF Transcript_109059/g.304024 Transcript_109059/m.304024 type:complete len:354 (-) Transcript_109059:131-1192(-)
MLYQGVHLLHPVKRLCQDGLRQPVVHNCLLVVSVLSFAYLGGALHLLLHLCDVRLGALDVLCQGSNRLLQISNLCLEAHLLVISRGRVPLVRVQLCNAPIPVLDLVRLLLAQLGNHLVNGLLHLHKAVQPRRLRQHRQARSRLGPCGALQHAGCSLPPVRLSDGGGASLHQGDVHGLVKVVKRFVRVQDLDRVLHSGNLLETALHPCVELRVGLRALLLQVCQKGLVQLELSLRVLKLLERLSVLHLIVRYGCVHLHNGLFRDRNLVQLCRLQGLVVCQGLGLGLLRGGQGVLEVLLHLLQDAKDLTTLGPVALEAGDGQKGSKALLALLHESLQSRRLQAIGGTQGQHVRVP